MDVWRVLLYVVASVLALWSLISLMAQHNERVHDPHGTDKGRKQEKKLATRGLRVQAIKKPIA